ncbi:MAG TPA: TrmH family RNA methyltransferase [Acidimicrobiia bacterium]|nr:TrmH family RNA methyltransferase [Acidimicrobiia bacterium]
MPDQIITSSANPRIKTLVGLRDRRNRDRNGVFIVEGPRLLARAVGAGHQPREIYYDRDRFDPASSSGALLFACSSRILSRASYRGSDEGVIAVFDQFDVGIDRLETGPRTLLLMAEGVEKPGNLGAILRTADAVGADAVIAADPEIDPFNPNVGRSSTGALFTVPIVVTDLESAIVWLRERRIHLVAADPSADVDLWSADLGAPIALLVGSEHRGLTTEARQAADNLVSIPMLGLTDSLNASVTMALLAYEARRQQAPAPGH